MRCALYARYSSDRQNERSIADQLDACRRHADARGWAVVMTFEDAAISGAAMQNRPGILALLEAARAGLFERVLVEDTDRLARDREHDAAIYKRLTHAGVTISTLTSEAVTPIESTFKGLMNELYLVNLSEKTSRGMRGNAEAGLATGSRLYGYRSAPGGAVEIVPDEAAIIRETFERFAAGWTARRIAADLNARAVPGPRGGQWAAVQINGNRKRGNGLLYTELYAGVKVFNRMTVVKDPESGRRLPRMKPPETWRRTPVEALRIVPDDVWRTVQARKERESAHLPREIAARRKSLLGGLVKCGCCGASYTAYRRGALICAAWRERGPAACANGRAIRRSDVEGRALAGLAEQLLAPAAVAHFVQAYRDAYAAEAGARRSRRDPIERRIAELRRRGQRLLDAYADERAGQDALDKAREHEAERKALEAELAAIDASAAREDAIELHPAAPARYAAMIEQLQLTLARGQVADEATVDALKGLVSRIDLFPEGRSINDPFRMRVHGDLARFIKSEQPAMAVSAGSWGRDRTADLWVMNPPL
jgi:site-specific DNA recombinase